MNFLCCTQNGFLGLSRLCLVLLWGKNWKSNFRPCELCWTCIHYFLTWFSLKIFNKVKSFSDLTVVKHLQNLWDYFEFKNDWSHFKVNDLILTNLEWTCVKWTDFFLDLLFVYEQIAEGSNMFFLMSCNERNFFKLGFGGKMN